MLLDCFFSFLYIISFQVQEFFTKFTFCAIQYASDRTKVPLNIFFSLSYVVYIHFFTVIYLPTFLPTYLPHTYHTTQQKIMPQFSPTHSLYGDKERRKKKSEWTTPKKRRRRKIEKMVHKRNFKATQNRAANGR